MINQMIYPQVISDQPVTLACVSRPFPSRQRVPMMWQLLKMYPNAVCHECGVKHNEVRNGKKFTLTRDHIIPTSKGGEDLMFNIQFLCYTHNQLKANH